MLAAQSPYNGGTLSLIGLYYIIIFTSTVFKHLSSCYLTNFNKKKKITKYYY